jgi:hypothetical protein
MKYADCCPSDSGNDTDNLPRGHLNLQIKQWAFIDRKYNRTFVVNPYYGYLRRDREPGGYKSSEYTRSGLVSF